MSESRPRITGTEMEWAAWIRHTPDGPLVPCPDGLPNALLQSSLTDRIVRDQRSGMTTNGARIYQDLGRFIEYATPEDTSYWATVTNELAGERIILDMLDRARIQGKFADYILNKRVLSDDGNTWGYHTSFSCDPTKISISQSSLHTVGMHLATQNIYAGAGGIWHRHNQPAVYALAQKVFNLTCDYSLNSHHDQPLLSTRDEPLADRLLRLHLTSMDANISPWATWMRLGTTSLVLSLLESGYKGHDIELEPGTMHLFAKKVALDTDMKGSVQLANGKRVRALDIQRTLVNHASKLDLSEQDQQVAGEWSRALDDLETDPERLRDRADWVIRRRAINRALEKHGDTEAHLDSHTAAMRDRGYDLLKKSVGLGHILRERGSLAQWMPSEQAIDIAIDTPPQTTRAKVRSALLREYYEQGTLVSGWDFVGSTTSSERHWLKDPWNTELGERDAA